MDKQMEKLVKQVLDEYCRAIDADEEDPGAVFFPTAKDSSKMIKARRLAHILLSEELDPHLADNAYKALLEE